MKTNFRKLKYFILILMLAVSAQAQNLRSGGKLKPEQAIMDIRFYSIVLNVDPEEKRIDGHTEIDLILSENAPILLFDLWNGLQVEKVWVNNKQQDFKQTEDHLIQITGKNPYSKGKQKVKIAYGGKPIVAERAPWIGGFQWEQDSNGNPWIAITCQMEGAKIYFPCKDHPSDEPNEGAELIITVPKGLIVAGPGLLKKVSHSKTTSTFHWRTNYTINNYGILFNVGKYAVVSREYTTIKGNKVPMDYYVLEENKEKAHHLLYLLERSAQVLEKYFGEYPFAKEKIGIAETPHLGMEHQTMNAYGNQYRYTKVGGEDFDWLLHHEFGHEWWANKVSNKDWAHMWIQEGICSFGDHLFTLEMEGEEAYLKRMQQTGRNAQNLKPIVQGEEVDSDDTYHPDIYGKGAFFMHSLKFVLGDEMFYPILLKLATDEQYTYHNMVTTDDVEQLFSKASGKDLKPFFDFYLRTTDKLEIGVKQISIDTYQIKLNNYDGSLPLEIQYGQEVQRINLNENAIQLKSASWPIIDPKGYYLKRVVLE
jgi:aminopeptidase N